ncbi:MAG: heme-binding protein [Alphaproteobacteria bacterium]|nr:heme-binding protein [Alphaproteobacteria bacterium]
MSDLTLQLASLIVDKALEHGRALGLAPLTVVVLDAGGHLKAAKREDGSSLLRPEIAMGKAWGVLGMGFGGRELARRAARAPQFFTALIEASGGRMVPVAGGVLIRSSAGAILGSVGVSGDASEKDEACAVHGIAAAGLVADTGGEEAAPR